MKFQTDDFEVTVVFGRPRVEYHNDGNGNYKSVTFSAPEELIHPAFKPEFETYVRMLRKMHENKLSLCKRAINSGLMRYIPPRVIRSNYSAYTFRKEIESRVGNIEEAKDEWDYNRAPAGVETRGKYGDLKAFIQQRAGKELKLNKG